MPNCALYCVWGSRVCVCVRVCVKCVYTLSYRAIRHTQTQTHKNTQTETDTHTKARHPHTYAHCNYAQRTHHNEHNRNTARVSSFCVPIFKHLANRSTTYNECIHTPTTTGCRTMYRRACAQHRTHSILNAKPNSRRTQHDTHTQTPERKTHTHTLAQHTHNSLSLSLTPSNTRQTTASNNRNKQPERTKCVF